MMDDQTTTQLRDALEEALREMVHVNETATASMRPRPVNLEVIERIRGVLATAKGQTGDAAEEDAEPTVRVSVLDHPAFNSLIRGLNLIGPRDEWMVMLRHQMRTPTWRDGRMAALEAAALRLGQQQDEADPEAADRRLVLRHSLLRRIERHDTAVHWSIHLAERTEGPILGPRRTAFKEAAEWLREQKQGGEE